jgi:predicted nucleotidyltransferase
MKPSLSSAELGEINSIFKKFPEIQEAILFGSRAMGNFKPASDVDIALKGALSFGLVARIKAALEEETSLPYLFDVVNYHTIETPAFKQHIDAHGRSIYLKSL